MKLRHLGIFGIISLVSYAAMVFLSPLSYPGYDPLSMAISDLGAVGAPSAALAERLNALYGPAAVVSVMAVCVGASGCRSKLLRTGIGLFAAMEWISTAGYRMFPLVMGEDMASFQNVMHILVTVLVVALSVLSLVLILAGGRIEGLSSLSLAAGLCLFCMLAGAMGTGLMPKGVFGLFERLSAFSAVVFNAFLGVFLWKGRFSEGERDI
ncbi:MAG: DUF998 domain-containing protein [Lachnospiraceae bacterium]|nr:DUF998 domain-containing protein [Lachnospiraceae bacterium]